MIPWWHYTSIARPFCKCIVGISWQQCCTTKTLYRTCAHLWHSHRCFHHKVTWPETPQNMHTNAKNSFHRKLLAQELLQCTKSYLLRTNTPVTRPETHLAYTESYLHRNFINALYQNLLSHTWTQSYLRRNIFDKHKGYLPRNFYIVSHAETRAVPS